MATTKGMSEKAKEKGGSSGYFFKSWISGRTARKGW
jgi:hypothetical protein